MHRITSGGVEVNKKLLFFVLSALIMAGSAAFMVFQSKAAEEQVRKAHYLQSLKDLVVATQKTRGLTNSYMNGNLAAQLLVYGERSEIKKAFKNLEANIIDPKVKKEIAGIHEDMNTLDKEAFKQESAKTFERYTRIIERLLANGTEAVKLNYAQNGTLEKKAASIMMEVVLPLTENIGKARGLGSGIVARGFCKDEEIGKMNGFVNEIERLSTQMSEEMKKVQNEYKNAYPLNIGSDIEKINANIKAYVSLSREKVIGRENITLDPNKYFDQGSAAISDALRIFKVNQNAISVKK